MMWTMLVLIVFLTVETTISCIVLYEISEIKNDMYDMKTMYRDILKTEIGQVNDCFIKWGKCVDNLEKTFIMLKELYEYNKVTEIANDK